MRWWLLAWVFRGLFLNAQPSPIASRTQDLSFIATQLPSLDPNFFSTLSRSEFQQAVNKLQANIGTLTDAQFYVGLAQLVAMAGDAHTYLYLSNTPGFQMLPLHLRWLDDGVFVTSAGPEYTAALGTRLIREYYGGLLALVSFLASVYNRVLPDSKTHDWPSLLFIESNEEERCHNVCSS
jgi:hypothetical protein